MPFFPHHNVLFIHIPKTGGSSIEQYFATRDPTAPKKKADHVKHMIAHKQKYLYTHSACPPFAHTLQHCTYEEICAHYGSIVAAQPKILISVRNPYIRLISDLFFCTFKKHVLPRNMNDASAAGAVQSCIERRFDDYASDVEKNGYGAYDNHARPQHHYVKGIPEDADVHYVHLENLKDDMIKIGYADFGEHANKGRFRRDVIVQFSKRPQIEICPDCNGVFPRKVNYPMSTYKK